MRRERCRDCGGTSVCEHGRRRHQCCECGGASVCKHGRRRQQCRDCGNFVCEIQGCPRQDLPFAGAPSLLGHMQTMHGDNPRAVTKSKELEVHQALRDAQITFEYQHHLPFRGATSCWRLTRSSTKPTTPAATCAGTSTWPPAWKLLVLRYNPDTFKIAGMTRRTTKKERHAQLIRLLGELLAREPEEPFTRLFLFYDRAAENSALPCVAEHWSEPVRAVSRCA